jgi:hypothetical protein
MALLLVVLGWLAADAAAMRTPLTAAAATAALGQPMSSHSHLLHQSCLALLLLQEGPDAGRQAASTTRGSASSCWGGVSTWWC